MGLKITIKEGKCDHAEIYHYPDGQKNVKLDMAYFNDVKQDVIIRCSIRNFSELELLLCIVAALRKNDFVIDHIEFMYLFGMRSDRAFEVGMPNYFRDVVAPIVNSLDCKVRLYYPHGTIASNYLNPTDVLLNPVHQSIHNENHDLNENYKIAGDKTALQFFYTDIYFDKVRENEKIKLSLQENFITDIQEQNKELPLMIVDDLCDGGATFIEGSKIIRKHFPDRKLYLFVAHAIFSKGVDVVAEHFDMIYCTNSYQNIDHPKVKQIKVI